MIIPVPGRDLMVQAWYQGGVSIMDFTDPAHPFEIASFDRGPVQEGKLIVAGSWSAYWFNGRIYSSEIARGLDVLKLVPSEHLSAAEIAAAEAVRADQINPQTQVRVSWADHPDVAQAYLDQLSRTPPAQAVDAAVLAHVQTSIDQWRSGALNRRRAAGTAAALTTAAEKATGANKGRMTALAEMFGRRAG